MTGRRPPASSGLRALITRPRHQAGRRAARLRARGIGCLVEPMPEIAPRVVLSIGGRPAQARVLVATAKDHPCPKLALLVTTPLGVAVLGAVAGSAAVFPGPDGSVEVVRSEEVKRALRVPTEGMPAVKDVRLDLLPTPLLTRA